ncbi:hypothetical protein B7W89_07475 [Agrobacterium tumefaciens]|uniref:AAA family ATPase n=1 Tax=Agrobacterium tumefaciens TaxID=358 RepID=UPI000B402234|nr:AAA family ATPase [Agrobacterium tumefaciens]NSY01143.1 AAA family ATPase [Agrobacterium tumefaciens]OVE92207.1 hypothetical protein B7W89_07475 [Agrobacterium tumefaciens]
MKLSAITLSNFRGVSELRIPLDEKMTVLVGRNGIGKSSILDALAIMLTHVRSLWQAERPRLSYNIYNKSDVQIGRDDYSLDLDFVLEDAIGEDVPLSLRAKFSDAHFLGNSSSFLEVKQFVQNETLQSGKDDLLVYYRQDRGFDERGVAGRGDRTTSLFGSLRAISQLEEWWDRVDAEEARHVRDRERDYRDPQLQAIRALIKEVDGFIGVRFSSTQDPAGLYFERTDGVEIHVSLLSTGERSFIILLADLARRLQMTKPNSSLHDIPAIVLIDEVELNLHPSWQSKILSTLSRVFKSCQFIVTTHSPQVISSVESRNVRILERNQDQIEVNYPLKTKGQTSNYLLEGVFRAHERDPEIDRLFDAFNEAVSKQNRESASELLNEITTKIEGDPPELLLLRKRLKGIQSDA